MLVTHSIGEVATLLQIAPSALRYYEAEGLLPDVERSPSGQRRFSDRDVEACRVIDCLKRSGLTIKDIQGFMVMVREGDATLRDRLNLFLGRREAVEAEIRQLESVRAVLDFKAWYYERAVNAGTEDAVRTLDRHQIPAQHRGAQDALAGRHV